MQIRPSPATAKSVDVCRWRSNDQGSEIRGAAPPRGPHVDLGVNLGVNKQEGRSNTLKRPSSFAFSRHPVGAEAQSRTGDTLIFSQVLYRLSYLG